MEEGCGGGSWWEEGGVVVEGLGEGWDYLGGGVGGCHGFSRWWFVVLGGGGGGVCIVLYWMEIFSWFVWYVARLYRKLKLTSQFPLPPRLPVYGVSPYLDIYYSFVSIASRNSMRKISN